MKDRIRQIMLQEKMNQKQFADALGVGAASLSNIFSGRTAPTMRHAEAVHRAFPRISSNWLLFGEGDMYISSSNEGQASGPAEGERGQIAQGQLSFDLDSLSNSNGDTAFTPGAQSEFHKPSGSAYQQSEISGGKRENAINLPAKEIVKYIDKPQRKIEEIRIFFNDGTYETFSPSDK